MVESPDFQNFNDSQGERSLSSFDVPQRLVASYAWDLPFGKGQRFGGGVTGVSEKPIRAGEWKESRRSNGYATAADVAAQHHRIAWGRLASKLNGTLGGTDGPCASRLRSLVRYLRVYGASGIHVWQCYAHASGCAVPWHQYLGHQSLQTRHLVRTPATRFSSSGGVQSRQSRPVRLPNTRSALRIGVVQSQANEPRLLQLALRLGW